MKNTNNFKLVDTAFDSNILLLEMKIYPDMRGQYQNVYDMEEMNDLGIFETFVLEGQSISNMNVIRGLHIQIRKEQSKIVRVISGEIFDVVLDLRKDSPTKGQWKSFILSEDRHNILYINKGFAHGFLVTSHKAVVQYKYSDYYFHEMQSGILWNDKIINIKWPLKGKIPIISDKDQALPSFDEFYKKN